MDINDIVRFYACNSPVIIRKIKVQLLKRKHIDQKLIFTFTYNILKLNIILFIYLLPAGFYLYIDVHYFHLHLAEKRTEYRK